MNDISASPEAILAPRHHAATIALHWVTLLLILLGLAAVFTRELFDEKPARAFLLAVHRNSGLLVLIMVAIRLLLRWPLGVGRLALARLIITCKRACALPQRWVTPRCIYCCWRCRSWAGC